MVIVNEASSASREIGSYYMEKRAIPAGNLCRITAPTTEEIDRQTYEKAVEEPIAKFLKQNRLIDRTRYVVTTLGVPLKISGTSGLKATRAAVDSELTLLYSQLQGESHAVESAVANPFFGRRHEPFRQPRFPIYLVTRLAAYDVETVKRMIDLSLEARNRGVVVLDLHSETDTQGNNWLRTAAILIDENRVVIDESPNVLYDRREVIGYASWGSNDSHRKRRFLGFEWLPGALATEYVSTNGRTFERPPEEWTPTSWDETSPRFAGSPQSLTADYLEEGATGASGHVYEPYLHMTPRPEYLFPAYLDGRNLAESYYLSIPALSWMNIVVGDPLCRLGNR